MQSATSSLHTLITHGAIVKTGHHTSVLVAKLNLQAVDHVAIHAVTHAVTHVATAVVIHVATHALPAVLQHVIAHVVQAMEAAVAVYQANGVFGLKAACRLINDLSIL